MNLKDPSKVADLPDVVGANIEPTVGPDVAPDLQPIDREPGTREDGEAMPPAAIDPAPDGKSDDVLRHEHQADGACDGEQGHDCGCRQGGLSTVR